MKRTIFILLQAVAACLHASFADETGFSVTPSGGAYYQFGQLQKTFDESQSWPNKTWDQRFDFRLSLNAVVQQHLRIIVGAEFATLTQVMPPLGVAGKTTTYYYAFPREGQGIYSFGDDEAQSPLQIAFGYFPFKYNPQASNMGEYLFRTGTYPPFIINDFDNCQARLLGMHISSDLFGSLRQDLLFTSETFFQPIGDYSLAYLVGYWPFPAIAVGAGISWNRLFPLDPQLTTKPSSDNIVFDSGNNPVLDGNDTLYYTFKGTKLMGRFSFDPKPLLPDGLLGIFGPEDGKLYAETAILGFRNYGTYFDDVSKRWPYMVGFNIPAFKVLDILSLEMEYINSAFDRYAFTTATTPIDQLSADEWVADSRFHWSIFSQKTITKGFSIKGLIGKDHYRPTGSNTAITGVDAPTSGGLSNGGELLVANGDWHYSVRVMFSF